MENKQNKTFRKFHCMEIKAKFYHNSFFDDSRALYYYRYQNLANDI